jgi:hypothetical protein
LAAALVGVLCGMRGWWPETVGCGALVLVCDALAAVPDALKTAEEQGHVSTTADRAHWNEAGHQIVSDALVAALTETCLLDLC